MSNVETRPHFNKMKEWALIIDTTPMKGSWNMAVDDFIFHSLRKEPQTYLRFYRWEKPTVSLGYSQRILKVVDVDYCRKNGIDIVRRMTGGKLVLHYKEATYSLCSSDTEIFTSTLMDSYRLISEALICGLKKMGLRSYLAEAPPAAYVRGNFPCFSYPARNEIEVEGKKIIGSAQKRVGSKFIQHGSIPLDEEEELLKSVSFLKEDKSSVRMISLSQALGKEVSFEWAVDLFTTGIAEYFGISLKKKVFNEEERETIQEIQKKCYDNSEWTYLRQ